MWWCLTLALAGPIDNTVEKGWLQIEDGHQAEAREAAKALLATHTDPQVVNLYAEASGSMGLGIRAVAETRGMDATLPWEQAAAPLAELVAKGDDAAVARSVETIQSQFPDHPEVFVPLWAKGASKKVVKLRQGVVRDVDVEDPAAAARLHRLQSLVGEKDVVLRAAVASKLEVEVYGPPARDVALHDQARNMMEKGWSVADLELSAVQRRDAVRRAHAMFMGAARYADAVTMWQGLGATDADAEAHIAEALRLAGDLDGAAAAAQRGWVALGRPTPDDVSVADTVRRTDAAVRLLSERSKVREAGGDTIGAWADAVAATVMAGEPLGADVGPRAAETLSSGYKGADKMAASLGALRSGGNPAKDAPAAWALVASTAATLPQAAKAQGLYGPSLAEVFAAAAVALAPSAPDDARAYGMLAVLTGPTSQELASLMASLHAQAGHADAAFHAAAVARGLGVDTEALLRANFTGIGDPLEVATAVGGAPPASEAAPPAPRPRRSVGRTSSPSVPPVQGARLAEPVPAWSVETPFGSLSDTSLRGRVVLMTFFTSDYAPCVEQLQASGSLARRMRARGLDVVHVGLSRDANRGRFDDLFRLGQRWGELAWAPEVASAFGIAREPTTWIVDRKGVARYFVDHRVAASVLEAQIEAIATE